MSFMMPNDPNEQAEPPQQGVQEAEVMPAEIESDEVESDEPEDELIDYESGSLPAIEWQAHEYVHHDKSGVWYAGLVGIAAVLIIVAVLTQQWLGVAVFATCAIAVAMYARRVPRLLSYVLDEAGVHIEGKTYSYEQFRSFGMLQDADWHTIDLEPMQRFMPRLSLLFDDADRDVIVERLAAELPRSDRTPDLVERLTHTLRF